MKTALFSLVILLGVSLSTQLGTSVDLQDVTKLKAVVGHLMQLPNFVKDYISVVLDIVIPHIKDDEKLKQALSTVKGHLQSPVTPTRTSAYALPMRSTFSGYSRPLSSETDQHMKRINDIIDQFTNRVWKITDERVKVAEDIAKIRYGGNKSV